MIYKKCLKLSSLSTFDGIIGYDFLRQIDAKIDTVRGYLLYRNGKEKLQFYSSDQVNASTIAEDSVPFKFQAQFQQGKIRTNTVEPIYN